MLNRRWLSASAALLLGGALAAALAGCGSASPQPDPAPTAPTGAPLVLSGITANSGDHSVALQNLFVEKPGAAGYPAHSSVKLSMDVWNNTSQPVALTSVSASGGATVVFVDGSSPSATPGTKFSIPLPPSGYIPLQPVIGALHRGTLPARRAGRERHAEADLPLRQRRNSRGRGTGRRLGERRTGHRLPHPGLLRLWSGPLRCGPAR